MPPTKKRTGTFLLSVFDGARQLLPVGKRLRFRLQDGAQKKQYDGFQKKPRVKINDLPFSNSRIDGYAVVVTGGGYEQTGLHPLKLVENTVTKVDLMTLKKRAKLRLEPALWRNLSKSHPAWTTYLQADREEDAAARRHDRWRDTRPEHLAAFLNFAEALSDLKFRDDDAFSYFKQPAANHLTKDFKRDRCFAFADPKLVEQIEDAVGKGTFVGANASLHPGATRSFKEVRFGVANVQITLHENDRKRIKGTNCIKVEVDIDYFRDVGAHALLEVIPNKFGGVTDPARSTGCAGWRSAKRACRSSTHPIRLPNGGFLSGSCGLAEWPVREWQDGHRERQNDETDFPEVHRMWSETGNVPKTNANEWGAPSEVQSPLRRATACRRSGRDRRGAGRRRRPVVGGAPGAASFPVPARCRSRDRRYPPPAPRQRRACRPCPAASARG